MNSRLSVFWLSLAVLVMTGLIVMLGRLGQLNGQLWDFSGRGSHGGHALPPGSGQAHAAVAEPVTELSAPTAEALAEAQAARDAELLKKLSAKVQDIGAMENEALLTFKDREALEAFLKRSSLYQLDVSREIDGTNTLAVKYKDLKKLRDELRDHEEDYAGIDANYLMRLPNAPQKDASNAGGAVPFDGTEMASIGAVGTTADRAKWGEGVTVAVLDTGINANHPTFRLGQIVQQIDLVGDGTAFNGHGTGMASLIAGTDQQAPGVSPGAKIIDIRVADSEGISDTAVVAQGIHRAVDLGANVVSLSLGTIFPTQTLEEAVNYAHSKGVLVIAAAGNEQYSQVSYPAAYANAIGVTGVDAAGNQAYFANSGKELDIAAPGVGILSGWGTSQIVYGDGTSQATALTSGAAVAAISAGRTPVAAGQFLIQNAKPLSGAANRVGAGALYIGK
jgi:subtilisin family serine protease